MVVLPQPLGPMRLTNSPSRTVRLMFWKMTKGSSPGLGISFFKSRNSSTGPAMSIPPYVRFPRRGVSFHPPDDLEAENPQRGENRHADEENRHLQPLAPKKNHKRKNNPQHKRKRHRHTPAKKKKKKKPPPPVGGPQPIRRWRRRSGRV